MAVVLWAILVPVTTGPGMSAKVALCRHEMSLLAHAATRYQDDCGSMPAGTRGEIMRCLRGNNPRKIVYFNLNSNRFNSDGEILDPWGKPYEIKLDSPTNVTLRSAGRNGRFGDKDDEIYSAKEAP
jgi:hypothetical protein